MQNSIKIQIANFKECFEGNPWYGIPIMKKLETIDWRVVNERPCGSRSIAVLLQHIINWRIFVLKKLQGDAAYTIIIDDANDWTEVHISDEHAWVGLKKDLRDTQEAILKILYSATDALLEKTVPGKDYPFGPILDSVTQHDIYHLGQIALVNSLLTK